MPAPLPASLFDLRDTLWVQHCSEGPVPRATAEAVRAWLETELRPWELRFREDLLGIPERTRAAAARLIGASPADVTLTATTSSALGLVAHGYPWRQGDEVLAPLGEFSTNTWPWLAQAARGASHRQVALWEGQRAGKQAWESTPPDADVQPERRLLEALTPATRVLTVSWVRFQDGLALDLGALARGCAERGVELVVDGIQGAGCHPVEVGALPGLGAFATGGHKGLLAPAGQGFLWTAPALRARLVPQGSWLSVEAATDWSRATTDLERAWREDGARLEQGGHDLLSCTALAASLELLNTAGPAAIAAHVAGLTGALLEGLAALPAWRAEAGRLGRLREAGRLGPIVALHHGGRGPAGLDALLRAGMARGIYASVREGYLRIALHGWHSGGDVERLLGWLAEG